MNEPTCVECSRKFNLFDPVDAQEWFYGHDCEENGAETDV